MWPVVWRALRHWHRASAEARDQQLKIIVSGPTLTMSTTTATRTLSRSPRKLPGPRGGIATASTPNLHAVFAAHSRLAPPSLSRKASFAALTSNSLASIPDETETYALATLNETPNETPTKMAPLTPGKQSADDIAIGDLVDVPGAMYGTVRFVGTVAGRKGTFAGVELHAEFAARGKNNGDVDGYGARQTLFAVLMLTSQRNAVSFTSPQRSPEPAFSCP